LLFFWIVVLESIRSDYEYVLKLKINLEKKLEEYTNELITIKSGTNSLINHLKEQTEQISLEKVNLFIYIKSKKNYFLFDRKDSMKKILDYVFNYKN
jgi:hypothetical protein